MAGLNRNEEAAIERAGASPMLARARAWSAINSGTGNLTGLAEVAGLLADAFSTLPGTLTLVDPAPADRVGVDGAVSPIAHGRHLHLSVRPEAGRRLLLTGHMDTVYPADHPLSLIHI